MSHYNVLVLTPTPDNVEEQVEQLLAPWNDDVVGECGSVVFCWDWYRIGGRWDGYLTRSEKEECVECKVDWRHHYERAHEQLSNNMATVPYLREDVSPDAIIAPDGVWVRQEVYNIVPGWDWNKDSERFSTEDEKLRRVWSRELVEVLATHRGYTAVTVDCHD